MPFLNHVLNATATFEEGRVVFAKAILDIITGDHVATMAVNAGGTGYAVGDTFRLTTGTAKGVGANLNAFEARGEVTAVSGGVVTAVKIQSAGAYSVDPTLSGGATETITGAGDDGLTIDVTMQGALWTVDTDDYTDEETDFEWIATSSKSTNPPTVGIQTITSTGNDAVRHFTASSYDNLSTWGSQPDSNPITVYTNVPSQNPEIFISVTERRINFVARDGNNVQVGGVGLFLPQVGNEAEYPFPALTHGQTPGVRAMSEQYNADGNGLFNASIIHPNAFTTVQHASYYRDNLSAGWKRFADGATAAAVDAAIWPRSGFDSDYSLTHAPQVSGFGTNPIRDAPNTSEHILTDQMGNGSSGGWFHNPGGFAGGVQGTAPIGTGGQSSFVVDAHMIQVDGGVSQVIGLVDGFAAVHGVGLTAFEEIESHNEASRYIVFPDTNTAVVEDWVAMEII